MSTCYDTRLEGGYFVSQEEENAALGKMVQERADLQKRLALLENEAKKFGELFTGLAAVIQPDRIWNAAAEVYEKYLSADTYGKIKQLKNEIPSTQQKVRELSGKLKQFGI